MARRVDLAVIELLTYSLEDQHVGVDRDTDREHEARESGQREHGAEPRECGQRVQDVDSESGHGEHAREAIVADHDDDDERERDRTSMKALV